MAGHGGLNLTHSEPLDIFLSRYGTASAHLRPMLEAFPPLALTEWANTLGAPHLHRLQRAHFSKAMKASPLLRAWLDRLAHQNVQFRLRYDWRGWLDGALRFQSPAGDVVETHDVTILAFGGASWPRLGADGGWITLLQDKGVEITKLRPANMGFNVNWSEIFRTRFAGQPLKNVMLCFGGHTARGDAMITRYGIEGGAVYALSSVLREALATANPITLDIDLRPDLSQQQIASRLARPRGKDSRTNYLRKSVGLSPMETNLLRETGTPPDRLKSIALAITDHQPIARAISTAGGISFDALDDTLMLKAVPASTPSRNARLGSADRRLSAAGLFLDRRVCRPCHPHQDENRANKLGGRRRTVPTSGGSRLLISLGFFVLTNAGGRLQTSYGAQKRTRTSTPCSAST